MNAKQKLVKIQMEGLFTAGQPFDQFIEGLCKRYTRTFREFLPIDNLEHIVDKLKEKNMLGNHQEEYLDLGKLIQN